MDRPVAVIDIGSNTTRLLVAEGRNGGFRRLLSQRSFTRLGRGGLEDGSISSEKIEELANVVRMQRKLANVLGAKDVFAFATAATRDATNRDEVVGAVAEIGGVDVNVLEEGDEARLAFRGATHAMPSAKDASIAVIDVGGGSTEIAVGTLEGGVKWSTSFRIGSATLTDSCISDDPPTASDLDCMRSSVSALFDEFPFPSVDQAIAIGGSASSLRRMVGNTLEHETLERAIRLMTENPAECVAEEFGIEVERMQVLPAGVMIIEEVSDRMELPLRIGKGGVREGKLLELLA